MSKTKKRLQGKARNQRRTVQFCLAGHVNPPFTEMFKRTLCSVRVSIKLDPDRPWDKRTDEACDADVYQARIPKRLMSGLETVVRLGGLLAVIAYLKPFQVELAEESTPEDNLW